MIFPSLHRRPHRAITLVELLVTLVIIAILSSLTLTGLAGVRQRTKIEKTKSTIRKVHELIIPRYESYLRRRVPLPSGLTSGTAIARERLARVRTLLVYEMPDSWADTGNSIADPWNAGNGTTPIGTGTSAITSYARTPLVQSYAAFRGSVSGTSSKSATAFQDHASSECLFLIVSRGLGNPDALEQFRSDEIGDTDLDNAPEFIDGWGQPIGYVRWPSGAHLLSPPSLLQVNNASTRHDPFDPFRVDLNAYALYPLIFSPGPDLIGNISVTTNSGWSPLVGSPGLAPFPAGNFSPLLGSPNNTASTDANDNISNHSLSID
jgi:type II secretory pathway pseudopilin PulG